MILLVDLEVLGQIADAGTQQGYLDLGGTGVGFVGLETFYYLSLTFRIQNHLSLPPSPNYYLISDSNLQQHISRAKFL